VTQRDSIKRDYDGSMAGTTPGGTQWYAAGKLGAIYGCLSAVYLLYLPHALPVLDDWTCLSQFGKARAGGFSGSIAFLRQLMDNTWMPQFRIVWGSFVPTFVFSFSAGFTPWPYFVAAWAAHLLTAVLLAGTLALLFADTEAGFLAGAIYAVFPACNHALFWPISTCFYHVQALALMVWFFYTWRKTGVRHEFTYSFGDLGLLVAVVFTGEQILPALLLLLPITYALFAENVSWRPFLRFWLIHAAAICLLLTLYALSANRMPILQGMQNRYNAGGSFSLRPFDLFLFGALGLNSEISQWTAVWRPHWSLALLALTSLTAMLAGLGFFASTRPRVGARRAGAVMVWAIAGVLLTVVSVARLNTFEWRYLYVPSLFIVAAGTALLAAVHRPLRRAAACLAVVYCLCQTYFEMQQCWIPQSVEARAALDAVTAARPFATREIVVLSNDHLSQGVAPSFITGASWAQQSMLENYTGADHIWGGRDVVVNEKGELAIYRRDSFQYLHRQEIPLLRVFVRDQHSGRFVPKSLMAIPARDNRYELVPLRGSGADSLPPEHLTMEELKRLPEFEQIYFVRRIHSHMKPTDL